MVGVWWSVVSGLRIISACKKTRKRRGSISAGPAPIFAPASQLQRPGPSTASASHFRSVHFLSLFRSSVPSPPVFFLSFSYGPARWKLRCLRARPGGEGANLLASAVAKSCRPRGDGGRRGQHPPLSLPLSFGVLFSVWLWLPLSLSLSLSPCPSSAILRLHVSEATVLALSGK